MAFFIKCKLLVSILLFNLVTSQTDCTSTNIISSQADVDKVRGCTWLASLEISIAYSDASVSLPNLLYLSGNVTYGNTSNYQDTIQSGNLTFISLPRLVNASSINIQSVSGFQSIDVHAVSYLGGNVILFRLPDFSGWNGFTSLRSAKQVLVYNTSLQSLSWREHARYSAGVENLLVYGNAVLDVIALPGLTNVAETLSITGNDRTEVQLGTQSVGDMIITHCARIASDLFPSLVNVTRTLTVEDNSFPALTFPSITRMGDTQQPSRFNGMISVINNPALQYISFPNLVTIEETAVYIIGNVALKTFDGFPLLSNITGLITFLGTFSSITLPSLIAPNPSNNFPLIINSTDPNFSCLEFDTKASPDNRTINATTYSCTWGSAALAAYDKWLDDEDIGEPLPKWRRVVLGVLVSVAAVVFFILFMVWLTRRKRKREGIQMGLGKGAGLGGRGWVELGDLGDMGKGADDGSEARDGDGDHKKGVGVLAKDTERDVKGEALAKEIEVGGTVSHSSSK